MNRDKIFKNIYTALLAISLIWLAAYKNSSDSLEIQNNYLKEEVVKYKQKRNWLQGRLRNCTGSNLIHHSIINDCNSCGKKAIKNEKLKEFYFELQ